MSKGKKEMIFSKFLLGIIPVSCITDIDLPMSSAVVTDPKSKL